MGLAILTCIPHIVRFPDVVGSRDIGVCLSHTDIPNIVRFPDIGESHDHVGVCLAQTYSKHREIHRHRGIPRCWSLFIPNITSRDPFYRIFNVYIFIGFFYFFLNFLLFSHFLFLFYSVRWLSVTLRHMRLALVHLARSSSPLLVVITAASAFGCAKFGGTANVNRASNLEKRV
jgi:hypothetical protein